MKIYTKGSELAFKSFTFPDGQPHFELLTEDDGGFTDVTVETAIRNPTELFQVLLVHDVLRGLGYSVRLDVRYLMAARMDRSINPYQPFTLQTVARLINGSGFTKVRILDVHSEVATRLIRNAENILPFNAVRHAHIACGNALPVAPDKGAIDRVENLFHFFVTCTKHRDPQTGQLSSFTVEQPERVKDQPVLIVDDICDGGGTFVGLAKELRKAGAKSVNLFCTHGIFSKGLPLEGIDRVFTTDSFREPTDAVKNRHHYPYENHAFEPLDEMATVIHVSMKDLK